MSVDMFFRTARVRHRIWEMRQEGERPPWTRDPAFSRYRFTNVFRELDRTTVWMRDHVREPWDNSPLELLAVTVFRWFNRIETGQVLFRGGRDSSLFGQWASGLLSADALRAQLVHHIGARGPFVTGAYIIKSQDGCDKLTGVLRACDIFRLTSGWREAALLMHRDGWTLQQAHRWLRQFPYQGAFTAYEVVSDLRWTWLLRDATDIMEWANPGPGAKRGLNRVFGRPVEHTVPAAEMLQEMQHLLLCSQQEEYWPSRWPAWEMREVEHWLCEFDKYQRVVLGEGRPRSTYP